MDQIKELFEIYISECEYIKRLRPETLKSSRESFGHFCRLMPELETISELTRASMTVFFKRLQTRERTVGKGRTVSGLRDSTVATYASRLRTFFKWLRDRKHIGNNPLEDIRLPNADFADRRALNGAEIKKIMGAVVQTAGSGFLLKRDLAMIGILTFCGIRRNELVSLEMRDIDLMAGYLTVRAETSKSKRLRRIPINPHLRFYLNEYFHERKRNNCRSQYLLVSNRGDRKLTLHGLKHWVARISRASGVKFHLHRFRHTFATNLAMQDVGIVKIQRLMGHTDIKMTQTYLRSVSTEEMREDVGKLSFENLN